MKVVIAIYTPAAYYPPTLNAIAELKGVFGTVCVISGGNQDRQLTVLKGTVHRSIFPRTTTRLSNINNFFRYWLQFLQLVRRYRPEVLLCYDDVPLLAWYLTKPFVAHRPILWFHSHDISSDQGLSNLSLQKWAIRCQRTIFHQINIFSLPANERREYYPANAEQTQYFFIPNYPSKYYYEQLTIDPKLPAENLKLIYQGRISDEHGLEELIDYIHLHSDLELTIIGSGNPHYLALLQQRIVEHQLTQRVHIVRPCPYEQLPGFTSKHDIGIAVNIPRQVIYQTGGTASNKLYEYAAAGLPTLYFDAPHYRAHMDKFKWAFPTDLSTASIEQAINYIRVNHQDLSAQARRDFLQKFNFETVFAPVLAYLSKQKG